METQIYMIFIKKGHTSEKNIRLIQVGPLTVVSKLLNVTLSGTLYISLNEQTSFEWSHFREKKTLCEKIYM